MRAGWSSENNQLRIGEALLNDHKSYGQNLATHGQCNRHRFICSCDRGLRRHEEGLDHTNNVLHSGDHSLLEQEDLPDTGDDFPVSETIVSGLKPMVFIPHTKGSDTKTVVSDTKTFVEGTRTMVEGTD